MRQVYRTLFTHWQNHKLPPIIPRNFSISLPASNGPHLATVITGFRRVGKTYLMYQTIQKLLENTPRDQILYLNLEDERILSPTTTFLTDLIPAYQAFYGHKPKYIFLDELQTISRWSKWARRILDTETEIELFITGSTSEMSSAELPTELRGRAFETLVYPLSFPEFLRFKNISYTLPHHSIDQLSILTHALQEYLVYGGLPAIALTPLSQKLELLQSYFRTVVERDIAQRYNLHNTVALPILLKLLVNTHHFTISKLHNDLKSMGIPIGKSTIELYLRYIESSYFFQPLYYWGRSIKKALLFPRVSYLIDNGFITALSPSSSPNYGRLLENLVHTELARNYDNLSYSKDYHDHEVDFVAQKNKKLNLYQVSYDTSSKDTLKRELRSLKSLSKHINPQHQYLISSVLPSDFTNKDVTTISSLDFFLNGKGVS